MSKVFGSFNFVDSFTQSLVLTQTNWLYLLYRRHSNKILMESSQFLLRLISFEILPRKSSSPRIPFAHFNFAIMTFLRQTK